MLKFNNSGSNKVYACGNGGKGQLGIPGLKLVQRFTEVPLPFLGLKYGVQKIVCGNLFSLLLATSLLYIEFFHY